MNRYAEMLQEAIKTYRDEMEKLNKERKPLDGIFGTGSSVKSNACHERFDSRIEEIMKMTGTDGASDAETGEAIAFLLGAASPLQEMNSVDMYLIAVQRHCIPMLCRIPPEMAEEMASVYEKTWPRRFRLPVQKEILRRLRDRAGR